MHYTKTKQLPGLMIAFDFQKEFDSVGWSFKFGDSFMKWVSMLYINVSSCVLNNSLRGRRNRARGAREARKNEGDWGEGRGNARHKNPIRFISAFAGKRKFLIG